MRGGGTTGQSGAIALGLAKGLAALEPEVEPLLKKGGWPTFYSLYVLMGFCS